MLPMVGLHATQPPGATGHDPVIVWAIRSWQDEACNRSRYAGRASAPLSRGLLAAHPGALPARRLGSLDLPVRGGGASLGVQPEPDRLIRPLRIVKLPAALRGAAGIDVVNRAIGTEDEPATVRKREFMWLESATSGRAGPCGLAPAELISHRGVLSGAEIDDTSKQSTVRHAIGSACGRGGSRSVRPSDQE